MNRFRNSENSGGLSSGFKCKPHSIEFFAGKPVPWFLCACVALEKNLALVFNELKKLLEPYSKFLEARAVFSSTKPALAKPSYHLWSNKRAVIAGRLREEAYFAGIILQKDFVGFYYLPAYAHAEAKKFFGAGLFKLLKGKSCFHVRNLTPEVKKQMAAALEKGFQLYKRNGWV